MKKILDNINAIVSNARELSSKEMAKEAIDSLLIFCDNSMDNLSKDRIKYTKELNDFMDNNLVTVLDDIIDLLEDRESDMSLSERVASGINVIDFIADNEDLGPMKTSIEEVLKILGDTSKEDGEEVDSFLATRLNKVESRIIELSNYVLDLCEKEKSIDNLLATGILANIMLTTESDLEAVNIFFDRNPDFERGM